MGQKTIAVNKNNGFTLVELLIGVGILSVVIVGMLQLFLSMAYLTESSANMTIVTQEIHSKIDEIRNTSFDDIIDTYACDCFDYEDNDSDGDIDFDFNSSDPRDSGCSQPLDDSEVTLDTAPTTKCSFSLNQLSGRAVIYLSKSPYFNEGKMDEPVLQSVDPDSNFYDANDYMNDNDNDVNDDFYEITIVASWTDGYGRVVGEDSNLNGLLDSGEDTDGNGFLSSPATVSTKIARR